VSRSEGVDQSGSSENTRGTGDSLGFQASQPRRDDVEFNELNIQLKISYKTLLLAFVLFDVLHKSINVLIDTDAVQNILN